MHNSSGRPVSGDGNFTETFTRSLGAFARRPSGVRRQSAHQIMAHDKLHRSHACRLWVQRPGREKEECVWRIFADRDHTNHNRLMFRKIAVTGRQFGDFNDPIDEWDGGDSNGGDGHGGGPNGDNGGTNGDGNDHDGNGGNGDKFVSQFGMFSRLRIGEYCLEDPEFMGIVQNLVKRKRELDQEQSNHTPKKLRAAHPPNTGREPQPLGHEGNQPLEESEE
jgi:hypothetical protein